MIRIGDFSKLSRVSIKTLRYYDEVGLLKPIDIDHSTGYRFYSVSQLPRLNRILALKDLGFSLEQIAHVLNEEVSVEQLRGMLRLKRAELQQHIVAEQERLSRIEARLNIITQEDSMSDYEVILKQIELQLVAGVRDILPSYPAIGRLCGEVYTYLARYGAAGIAGAIWHNGEFKTSDIDGEAVAYLTVAYALKFLLKQEASIEYVVMPLEGLWWADNGRNSKREDWQWTMMIMQPNNVTNEWFTRAMKQIQHKQLPALEKLRLENFHEERAVQIMHIGPFATEEQTLEKMERFLAEHEYVFQGKHHEIYLRDPRRTAPEKLRTVLRQPFKLS